MYGYEFVVNSLKAAMGRHNITPMDLILVPEGMNSKAPRLMISKDYKSDRDSRPNEAYEEFGKLRDMICDKFRKLGAMVISQDSCEADDTLAWLAKVYPGELVIFTNDGDLTVLNSPKVKVDINGVIGDNKYGAFPVEYVTLYKAMVGDSGDKISGIPGFGKGAWVDFHAEFGIDGMAEMTRLAELGSLDELVLEAQQNKMVGRIYAGRVEFLRSYKLAKLYPSWVNQMMDPVKIEPGMVQAEETDERLVKWKAQTRLITADNYERAMEFLREKLAETPFYTLDLETSSTDESDDWGANFEKPPLDVLDARITGGSISFGDNLQYAYYISVDHKDTKNVTLHQFGEMIRALPTENKLIVAHNAQGFELIVMATHFAEAWKDNGWRGFVPNMVDTRISSTWVDENQYQHGLKHLTKMHFGYEQVSYEEITRDPETGHHLKMNQLTGKHVELYGCDDVFGSAALWVYHQFMLALETELDNYIHIEQRPMYLQAHGFIRGVPINVARLSQLATADDLAEIEHRKVIDAYLISQGWAGTVCPVYTVRHLNDDRLLLPAIKETCELVLGIPLETRLRTISKVLPLVAALDHPNAHLLANAWADAIASNRKQGAIPVSGGEPEVRGDLSIVNELVRSKFSGKPEFNTGSPKQMQDLLYKTMGLPIRLRNKPTDTMRAAGIREGNPRADEDAMMMAIKQGDAEGDVATVLKALNEAKSITTRRGLYWAAYPKMLHHKDGLLHPTLQQSWTNTRRYSGKAPNVQQQDKDPNGVRSVMLPHHKNAIIVSLDESAQEVRQLADYCLDPALLSCYLGDASQLRDVHSIVGCKIAGIDYLEFRIRLLAEEAADGKGETGWLYKTIRNRAKITLFATIYGAAAPKIGEGLGITEQEAQGYIDAIYAQFPGVAAWKLEAENKARTQGYVNIHGGGRRHLASLVLSDDKYTASKAMRQSGNAQIQAGGGNQIKTIMGDIWDDTIIEDYDYVFYFSVHDETIHSVAIQHAEACIPRLHAHMTKQFLNKVPSASSIGVGRNFGQLKELGEQFDADLLRATLAGLFEPAKEAEAA